MKIYCDNCYYQKEILVSEYSDDYSCAICGGDMFVIDGDIGIYKEYQREQITNKLVMDMAIQRMKDNIEKLGNDRVYDIIMNIKVSKFRDKLLDLFFQAGGK